MAEKILYERLGGVFAISAVVDHFSYVPAYAIQGSCVLSPIPGFCAVYLWRPEGVESADGSAVFDLGSELVIAESRATECPNPSIATAGPQACSMTAPVPGRVDGMPYRLCR